MKEELERIKRECEDLKKEEADLIKRINKEKSKKTGISVKASSKFFPYTETTVKIQGTSKNSQRKIKKYSEILEEKLESIKNKYVEVEDLLDKIESPRIRLIARLKYIDRKEWSQIASELKVTPDSIRVEFDRYIKRVECEDK